MRNVTALVVAVTWILMSAMSPVAHTCSLHHGSGDGPTLSSGTECVSCEWIAAQTSVVLAPPPPAAIVVSAAAIFAIPAISIPVAAPALRDARAPPTLG